MSKSVTLNPFQYHDKKVGDKKNRIIEENTLKDVVHELSGLYSNDVQVTLRRRSHEVDGVLVDLRQ